MAIIPGLGIQPDDMTANDWAELLRKQGAAGRTGGATSSVPSTPTVAPPPPTKLTVGGFTPDYNKLILGDPDYQAFQANSAKSIGDAAAARTAALKRLVIQYGGLGQGFQDQYGDIDQQTLDLAKGNQFSDTANLQRNYEQGIEAFKRQLAGRGALDSGDLGYGLQQAEFSKGQQGYDLSNQFGAAAGTVENNFVGAVDAQRGAQISALQAARASQFANPANRPVDAQDAAIDHGLSTQYGKPIYRDPGGNLWTIGDDGNPVAWNQPGPSAPSTDPNAGASQSPTGSYADDGIYYQVQPDGTVKQVVGRPSSGTWIQ